MDKFISFEIICRQSRHIYIYVCIYIYVHSIHDIYIYIYTSIIYMHVHFAYVSFPCFLYFRHGVFSQVDGVLGGNGVEPQQ